MEKYFEGKRVLVTGATGLIGSYLTKRLLNEGAIVIAAGRNEDKLKVVFGNVDNAEKLVLKVFDAADGIPDDVGTIDYFFHAASPISGVEIKEKPVETIRANLYGVQNGLEYLRKQNSGRMIIFSSATAYGNQLDYEMIVNEENTDRADPLHTLNTPYSESKRMIEVLAGAYYRQYGVDSVIVRIGYVYGPAVSMPNTAFYEFIKKAIRGEDVILNNSGMARRDNIYVDDVVNGLVKVAISGNSGEAYNISSNGDKENYKAIDELAAIIVNVANEANPQRLIKCVVKPIDGERNPGMKLDNHKLKKLGWNVEVDIESGIRETYMKYEKETMV